MQFSTLLFCFRNNKTTCWQHWTGKTRTKYEYSNEIKKKNNIIFNREGGVKLLFYVLLIL